MNLIKLLLPVLTLSIFLSSCSSSIDSENQGIKMDVLYQKNSQQKLPNFQTGGRSQQGLNSGFVRDQQTELENKFPRLPNPVLNLFVFPHLTKDNNPVPGYTTNFNLYRSDQYALPGEVF